MSKNFFAQADDVSDDEDISEEESEEEKKQTKGGLGNRFANISDDDDDDDDDNDGNDQDGDDDSEYTYGSESDDGNKVKSFSDKRIDNVMAHISKINNALKINDFSALQSHFDDFFDDVSRNQEILKESSGNLTFPKFVIKTIIQVEDAVNEVTPEQKKKFNKNNNGGHNKLKNKLKKMLAADGEIELIVTQVSEAKANPDILNEQVKTKKKRKTAKKVVVEEPVDDDDDLLPSKKEVPLEKRRLRWLKKEKVEEKGDGKTEEQKKDKKDEDAKQKQALIEVRRRANQEKEEFKTQIQSKEYLNEDYTKPGAVATTLKELKDLRTTVQQKYSLFMMPALKKILSQVTDPRLKVEALILASQVEFDVAIENAPHFMQRQAWLETVARINSLIETITKKSINFTEPWSDSEEGLQLICNNIETHFLPIVANFVEKLSDELLKAFQANDGASAEYMRRLRDENDLLFLVDKVIEYLKEYKDDEKLA